MVLLNLFVPYLLSLDCSPTLGLCPDFVEVKQKALSILSTSVSSELFSVTLKDEVHDKDSRNSAGSRDKNEPDLDALQVQSA